MTRDIQRHFTFNTRLRKYKIVLLGNVSLNYISWLDCLSRYRSLSYRFACCYFLSSVDITCRTIKMPRVSNEYGVLEVKCKRK